VNRILLITLLALLLAACTGAGQPTDPLVSIDTRVGKEFKLVLESNPTTGYHWEVVGDLPENLVELVSRDYKADQPQLTGSGGVEIWTFKAVGAGGGTITLGYFPPSNEATEPQKTESFTVNIKQ
jgi:predicted secreted protein